jgi:phosphoribosylglycinamide formyltransferase-1
VRAGLQPLLIEDAPDVYYTPPYVGTSGWVGIRLDRVGDDALQIHLREAWDLTARARKSRRTR